MTARISVVVSALLICVACGGGNAATSPSPGGGGSGPVFVTEANSATDGSGAAFNRASISLNVSGPNPLLIAAWHSEFDGGFPDGWIVTDNGAPGTLIVEANGYSGGDGNRRFRVYYWMNPAFGSNTITVSNPFSGDNELAVAAIVLSGVAQGAPLGAVARDVSTGSRTGESETVATAAGDLVVHVIANALFARGTLGAGETSRSIANDGGHPQDGDASLWISTKPGASGNTTVSSSGWAGRVINGVAIVVHGV